MDRKMWGYILRFVVLYVFVYAIIGIAFFEFEDYETALATKEQFELFRPLDNVNLASTIPVQLMRGAILALIFYPLYNIFTRNKYSWLLLFGLLYVSTATMAFPIPEFIDKVVINKQTDKLLIGFVEITIQMFIFSWLLCRWVRKRDKKFLSSELESA